MRRSNFALRLQPSLLDELRKAAEMNPNLPEVNSYYGQALFSNGQTEESKALLGWLYSYCSQPNFTFRHRWSVGDLVMWDNRCVQHFAIADYGSNRRTMNRVTVLGDRPR